MSRPTFRHARLALVASLTLSALTLGACAKKPVSLTDPSLAPPVYPEGKTANAHLVTYPDIPVPIELWQDNGLPGESDDDVLLSTSFQYESGPGAVVGMIIDSTNASQYQIYKRQGDGGFVDLFSYTIKPVKTWPVREFDEYLFSDPHPYAPPERQYIGRGVVDGQVTAQAPLTNPSDLTQVSVPGHLQYLSPVDFGPLQATTDSLVPFKWAPVAGAAGYWLTMYAYTPAYLSGTLLPLAALPRPVPPERVPDYFSAYIPAPATSYTLYDPLPTGSQVIDVGREVVTGVDYAVRIAAVDANGQLLDYVGGNGAYLVLGAANGEYFRFPMNALLVRPAPAIPPMLARLHPTTAAPARSLRLGEVRVSRYVGPRH